LAEIEKATNFSQALAALYTNQALVVADYSQSSTAWCISSHWVCSHPLVIAVTTE